jgi:hypothetical protein
MENSQTGNSRAAVSRPRLRFGKHSIPLPRSRTARIATGGALLVGGSLWFLPVLGLWMLPAGVLVLSAELGWVRRARRRAQLWWGRRKQE